MMPRILTIASFALLFAQGAQASIYYDTINPSTVSINGNSGVVSDGSAVMSASFYMTGGLDFNSVSVLASADDPTDGGSTMVYLVADDGSGGADGVAGAPDFTTVVLIGSIDDASLNSIGTPTYVTLGGFANTVTTQNNEYWITLDATNSSAEWIYNTDDSGIGTANQASASDGNGLYPDDGSLSMGVGAFALTVDAPEPTSLALVGAALTGFGYFRRRRQNIG